MKPSFFKVFLCLLLKYIVFFSILSFVGDRFKSIVLKNSQNGNEILLNSAYYLLYVVNFTMILALSLAYPLYLIFKITRKSIFVLGVASILIAEYLLYTFLASPSSH